MVRKDRGTIGLRLTSALVRAEGPSRRDEPQTPDAEMRRGKGIRYVCERATNSIPAFWGGSAWPPTLRWLARPTGALEARLCSSRGGGRVRARCKEVLMRWRARSSRKMNVASMRSGANVLCCWRICGNAACRRAKRCRGRVHLCGPRNYALLPEGVRGFFELFLAAKHGAWLWMNSRREMQGRRETKTLVPGARKKCRRASAIGSPHV